LIYDGRNLELTTTTRCNHLYNMPPPPPSSAPPKGLLQRGQIDQIRPTSTVTFAILECTFASLCSLRLPSNPPTAPTVAASGSGSPGDSTFALLLGLGLPPPLLDLRDLDFLPDLLLDLLEEERRDPLDPMLPTLPWLLRFAPALPPLLLRLRSPPPTNRWLPSS